MAKKNGVRKAQVLANPFMAAAARDLRRSSAASPHVQKQFKGTRSANNKKAVREFGF